MSMSTALCHASHQPLLHSYSPAARVCGRLCRFHHTSLSSPNGFARRPLTSTSGTALYFWFLLTDTAFPWRHNTIGTAEDMGLFFGSLWVLL